MGPRSAGMANKGSPSLYCFAVFRTEGYEADLLRAMREKNAGIFDCDHYSMLTADSQMQVGDETTTQFQGAQIIGSVDGTAGNTELFVHVWKKSCGTWRICRPCIHSQSGSRCSVSPR